MDFELILKGAYAAADCASALELGRMPEDPNAFGCGFAWVVVKPATGPFVRWCKAQQKALGVHYKDRYNLNTLDGDRPSLEQYEGAKHLGSPHHPSGWDFWCPGHYTGQSIRMLEAGASAFAQHMQRNGINASMSSRLD